MKCTPYILTLVCFSFLLQNKKPITLKNTVWLSNFFHYHNEYHFKTDSTGYSFDGRRAFSLPLDSADKDFDSYKVLYNDSLSFTYKLSDSLLTIIYKNQPKREFKISNLNNALAFKSIYQYTYGHEWLEKGKTDTWMK